MHMTSPRSRSCCSLADSSSSCAWQGARLPENWSSSSADMKFFVSPDAPKRLNLVHPYTSRQPARRTNNRCGEVGTKTTLAQEHVKRHAALRSRHAPKDIVCASRGPRRDIASGNQPKLITSYICNPLLCPHASFAVRRRSHSTRHDFKPASA